MDVLVEPRNRYTPSFRPKRNSSNDGGLNSSFISVPTDDCARAAESQPANSWPDYNFPVSSFIMGERLLSFQ